MEFREKMIFLMDVTNTSNKMLANAINVDPSMISLIRTGRRGKPHNELHIRSMSAYFAARCRSLYPDSAIRKTLRRLKIIYEPQKLSLSDLLFEWLSDLRQLPVDNALLRRLTLRQNLFPTASDDMSNTKGPLSFSNIYYGDSGKIEAFRAFYHFCLSMNQPATIYFSSDENSEWYIHTPSLWQEMMDWKMELASRGFHFVQILPPPGPSLFYSTLTHWLPLYTTGLTEVYFYPRYRDTVYRHTLFVVPGYIALSAQSVAMEQETPFTFLSTDKEFIGANFRIFEDYRKLCIRTMACHRDYNDILECMMRFRNLGGGIIQRTASPSASSMPEDLLRRYILESSGMNQGSNMEGASNMEGTPDLGDISDLGDTSERNSPYRISSFSKLPEQFNSYLDFEKRQRQQEVVIELCPVASAYLVTKGEVPVYLPGFTADHQYYYTPQTYRRHLENIIRLLKENPDYYFVPLPYTDSAEEVILVRPQKSALMFRTTPPVSIFEISQPDMTALFYLYLLEIAERNNYQNKPGIIARLEQLVETLK